MKNTKRMALEADFPHTLPIMAGFLFLGMPYGIYSHSLGFSFVYPIVMALTIFAGSMEFVSMDLLLGPLIHWVPFYWP
ncbi:MAG: AzlC family ABC transporter permease [Eubacterium aggregans]